MKKTTRFIKFFSLAAATVAALAIAATLVPSPRPARAQFTSQALVAVSVGGSANAITMTVYNMDTLVKGVPFSFVPTATNTGPTTINVNSIGATATRRPSSIGLTGLAGGEIQNGVYTTVVYDGTNINIVYPLNPAPVGSIVELRGSAAPPGYLIEDGSCVSQTTYATLFSVIATTYGTCSAGLFSLPDSRGTMFAALDNQGANGSAGRITSGGSGCTATSIGLCGSQNQTLSLAQLPVNITSTTTGGSMSVSTNTTNSNNIIGGLTTSTTGGGGATINVLTGGSSAATVSSTGVATGTVQSNNTNGNSHPLLNPVLLGTRAIKF